MVAQVAADEPARVSGLVLVAAALVAVACGSPTSPSSVSGVAFSQTDLVTGTGTVAASGNRVTVAYTGWLYDASKSDNKGTAFDSGTIRAVMLRAMALA